MDAQSAFRHFNRMNRHRVAEFLKSWGFTVYDDEPTDDLRVIAAGVAVQEGTTDLGPVE